MVNTFLPKQHVLNFIFSLRSWQDFGRECFCFGSEAVNTSGKAVRGLVKSQVEFLPLANSLAGSVKVKWWLRCPLTNPASYAGYFILCNEFYIHTPPHQTSP